MKHKHVVAAALCISILLVQGCASKSRLADHAGTVGKSLPDAAANAGMLSRDQLPTGFAVGGAAPFGLTVRMEGATVTSAPALDIGQATVTLERVDMGSGTSARVRNSLDATIKYDLYISPDGNRFFYTSSCPLAPNGSGYETWPQQLHSFAIGNPRVVSTEEMTCM